LAVKSKFGLGAVRSQVGAMVPRQVDLKRVAVEKEKTREREEQQGEGKEIARA
jgi:hypothetical protein